MSEANPYQAIQEGVWIFGRSGAGPHVTVHLIICKDGKPVEFSMMTSAPIGDVAALRQARQMLIKAILLSVENHVTGSNARQLPAELQAIKEQLIKRYCQPPDENLWGPPSA